jgi:hypothetical protein
MNEGSKVQWFKVCRDRIRLGKILSLQSNRTGKMPVLLIGNTDLPSRQGIKRVSIWIHSKKEIKYIRKTGENKCIG